MQAEAEIRIRRRRFSTNYPLAVRHSEAVLSHRVVGNTLPDWCSPGQIQACPPGTDSAA